MHQSKLTVAVNGLSLSASQVSSNPDSTPNVFSNLLSLVPSSFRLPGRKLDIIPVLKDVSLALKPATATAILAAPGSGKTALLRALAGRNDGLMSSGATTYNGLSAAGLRGVGVSLSRLAAFAAQEDEHEPLLTVRETLAFVHKASTPSPSTRGLQGGEREEAQKEYDAALPALLHSMGLEHCSDTVVGGGAAGIRGVSGGQKRRVTVAEAMVRQAPLLLLDEPTNGLDASTAVAVLQVAVERAQRSGGILVAALQAPTPEICALFDQLILLSGGHLLYAGAREGLRPWLASMGFHCPHYMDIADYAVQLATSPSLAAAHPSCKPVSLQVPVLAKVWADSVGGQAQRMAVQAAEAEKSPLGSATDTSVPSTAARVGLGYANPVWTTFPLVLARQATVLSRNKALLGAKLGSSTVMGLILGSVFWGLQRTDFTLRLGLMAFALSFLAFSSQAEVPVLFTSKAIVRRHVTSKVYPAWMYGAAVSITNLPLQLAACAIFISIIYRFAAFAPLPESWAMFLAIALCMELAMNAFFRLIAIAVPALEAAQAMAGAGTGVLFMYNGFLIVRSKLPTYALLAYYISPFSWAVRSLAAIEWKSAVAEYDAVVPTGASTTQRVGDLYLSIFDLDSSAGWVWGGAGLLVGYAIVLGILLPAWLFTVASDKSAAASSRSRPAASSPPVDGAYTAVSVRPAGQPGPTLTSSTAALPTFEPVHLAYKDVRYSVVNGKTGKKVQLLSGISDVCVPGSMTALMGASGAGKSTLLDVLAGRKTQGDISGTITLNGKALSKQELGRITAYCEQMDSHCPEQTVYEATRFSALLRMKTDSRHRQGGASEHSVHPADAMAAQVLDLVDLSALSKRTVASLTPSESKRLTIAVELAANPGLLFLDEPTSGLSAAAAASVMKAIRKVAASGRTVLCTIHQPSAEIFFAFDRLVLLAPGGMQVYAGSLGKEGTAMVDYFYTVGKNNRLDIPQLPDGVNPATWMLDVLYTTPTSHGDRSKAEGSDSTVPTDPDSPSSVDVSSTPGADKTASRSAASELFSDAWSTSTAHAAHSATVSAALTRVVSNSSSSQATQGAQHASFLTQLYAVTQRQWHVIHRGRFVLPLRVFLNAFLALFFGMVWRDVAAGTDQASLYSQLGGLIAPPLFTAIMTLASALPMYFKQRPYIYRERASGLYGVESLALANAVVDIPHLALISAVYLAVLYPLMGFSTSPATFFTCWLAVFLFKLCFLFYAQTLEAFVPVYEAANIFAGLTFSLSILFSGNFIGPGVLKSEWDWFYYIQSASHTVRTVVQSQFHCAEGHTCKTYPVVIGGTPVLITAEQFGQAQLDATYGDRWTEVGWLLLVLVVFKVLAYVGSKLINHQKR